MKKRFKTSFLLAFITPFICAISTHAYGQITVGNDTTIMMLDSVHFNTSDQHDIAVFDLPHLNKKYQNILLKFQLECPPGGCDPWARIANINVITEAGELFEIGRFITPPDTGGCEWTLDITDFRSIMHGPTQIEHIVYSSFNGQILHTWLEYTAGTPVREAYKIENLWGNQLSSRWEFGNPNNPIENHIPTQTISTDSEADSMRIKVVMTGHGRGNTDDALEYYINDHSVVVNQQDTITHSLYADCSKTACEQNDTVWFKPRSGWCPGDAVQPWDVNLNNYTTPGNVIAFDYAIEPYENHCRPGASPCLCPDCNYDGTYHTQPFYLMQSQLVYYKDPADVIDVTNGINSPNHQLSLSLHPNPASDFTQLKINTTQDKPIVIEIVDLLGRVQYTQQTNLSVGINNISLDVSALSGYHLVKVYNNEQLLLTSKTLSIR